MDFTLFTGIMAFYAVLTYLVLPAVFYYTMGKTLKAAGNGFVVGSVLSVVLWMFFGSKM